jgi:hypothetical protein
VVVTVFSVAICRLAGIPLPFRPSDAIVNSSFTLLTTHGLLLDDRLVAFARCESWEWHTATSAADLQSRPPTFKLQIRHALVSPQSHRVDVKRWCLSSTSPLIQWASLWKHGPKAFSLAAWSSCSASPSPTCAGMSCCTSLF